MITHIALFAKYSKIIISGFLFFITISCSNTIAVGILMPQNFYTQHTSHHLSEKDIIQTLKTIKKSHFPQNLQKINFVVHTTKNTCNNNVEETKKYLQSFIKKDISTILDLTCKKTFLQTYAKPYTKTTATQNQNTKSQIVIITPHTTLNTTRAVLQNALYPSSKTSTSKNNIPNNIPDNIKTISTAVSRTAVQVAQASFLQDETLIALVHDGLPYAHSAIKKLQTRLTNYNVKSTIYNTFPPNRQNFSKTIKEIISSSSSAVVFEGLGSNVVRFLSQLRDAGFEGVLLLPVAVDTPTFLENILYTLPKEKNIYIPKINKPFFTSNIDSSVKEFFLWYKTLFNKTNFDKTDPNIDILQLYSALQLFISLSIEKNPKKNPKKNPETQPATQNKKYKLLLGEIYFDTYNTLQNTYTIVNIKN